MLKSSLQYLQQTREFEKAIKQFGEIVLKDPSLLTQLDATPDKDSFIQTYIKLAADRGIKFTSDELLVASGCLYKSKSLRTTSWQYREITTQA